MSIDFVQDRRVLALRADGRSFGAIARELCLEGAASAYAAGQLRAIERLRRRQLAEWLDRVAEPSRVAGGLQDGTMIEL